MSDLIVPSRRGFIKGLGALWAAPAIVRFASLMPVKALTPGIVAGYPFMTLDEYAERIIQPMVKRFEAAAAEERRVRAEVFGPALAFGHGAQWST